MRYAKICTLALLLAVSLSGCTFAKDIFTNPTGKITIDRQEFVNTYAVVKVLYKRLYAQALASCERHAKAPAEDMMLAWNCEALPGFHAQARSLDAKIQAKIEVPESEIDWATVTKMLEALIGLVPG